MTLQNPTIELLDRKYAFVNDAQDEVFLLELERFLNFLLTDERFKDYAQLISQEWVQKHAEYQRKLAEGKDRLIELKKRFVARYPEIDDSNVPKPNALSINFEYEQTFANFDEVAKDDWQPEGFSPSPGKYNDDSSVNKLLGILHAKIEEVRENYPNQIDKEIGAVLVELKNQHRYIKCTMLWNNLGKIC